MWFITWFYPSLWWFLVIYSNCFVFHLIGRCWTQHSNEARFQGLTKLIYKCSTLSYLCYQTVCKPSIQRYDLLTECSSVCLSVCLPEVLSLQCFIHRARSRHLRSTGAREPPPTRVSIKHPTYINYRFFLISPGLDAQPSLSLCCH
jgi:hypothetical protein